MSSTEATTAALTPAEAHARLAELTVVDVRTPGEHATGHVPGALNIPLDHLADTLPDLREAAAHGTLLVVCASGNRSARARDLLAEHGIPATDLTGGTTAWAAQGHPLSEPAGRRTWSMERQVRFTAGATVLTGLALGALTHRSFRLLSAGIASGLVFSAVTDTCGMAAVLAKLPHNRPAGPDLDAARAALRTRTR
ncbi:transporter [Streptomyces sp. V2]|uniref:rhodanese-like domain-containing protein n=2 Tax=Streptomyces TaxID=1883 RepID=UPI000D66BAD7|nr:rhodanese-like domain-containing protein [Streptomyces sp. V2]PWG07848.1 transporter [Streptomyces sp. V2]